eukprot:5200248-Amphidinium_carterae.2
MLATATLEGCVQLAEALKLIQFLAFLGLSDNMLELALAFLHGPINPRVCSSGTSVQILSTRYSRCIRAIAPIGVRLQN